MHERMGEWAYGLWDAVCPICVWVCVCVWGGGFYLFVHLCVSVYIVANMYVYVRVSHAYGLRILASSGG